MTKTSEMDLKLVGPVNADDREYESAEGYLIIGNPDDGYRAEAPDGKTIVMWSIRHSTCQRIL